MSTHSPTRKGASSAPTAKPEPRKDKFEVVGSDRSFGFNLPQQMGRTLWAPMLAMAVMAFAVALILGFVRANVVATRPDDAVVLLQLQHDPSLSAGHTSCTLRASGPLGAHLRDTRAGVTVVWCDGVDAGDVGGGWLPLSAGLGGSRGRAA